VEAMKFNEVAPNLNLTRHAITIRPLCFSSKTFAEPAQGPAGRHRQGRQGGRCLRPADRILRRPEEARRDGKGRQTQADSVRRPRRHAEAGGPGHGRVRQGNRRRSRSTPGSTRSSSACAGTRASPSRRPRASH
jgi:hypothetical protein